MRFNGINSGIEWDFSWGFAGSEMHGFFRDSPSPYFLVDNLDYFPYVSFTAHGRSILMTWRFKPSPFRPADPRRGSQKSDIWIQGYSISRMDFPFHELTHPQRSAGLQEQRSRTEEKAVRTRPDGEKTEKKSHRITFEEYIL